jgi:hypothetical protein
VPALGAEVEGGHGGHYSGTAIPPPPHAYDGAAPTTSDAAAPPLPSAPAAGSSFAVSGLPEDNLALPTAPPAADLD